MYFINVSFDANQKKNETVLVNYAMAILSLRHNKELQ